MRSATDEYRQEVWDFLEKIKPGDTYTIDKLCKAKNREQFVNHIKEYMDAFPFQAGITFNQDYTKFYRMEPLPFEVLVKCKELNQKTSYNG